MNYSELLDIISQEKQNKLARKVGHHRSFAQDPVGKVLKNALVECLRKGMEQ